MRIKLEYFKKKVKNINRLVPILQKHAFYKRKFGILCIAFLNMN